VPGFRAHLHCGCAARLGVPTRYVSGYLVTRRSRSAQGSSASHAGVEVLVPQMGWCAFDPTNNVLANDYYIKLASGCDYRDVPPTRGMYKGYGVNCLMRVRVHTIVEGESLEAGDQAESDDAPTLENDADASTQRAPHELVG
jgi:transglutaminase-like putative cysteine protease